MAINQPSRLAAKSIVVFDPSPNINKSLTGLILGEVRRGKALCSPLSSGLWQLHDGARIERFDVVKILFFSVAEPADLNCMADVSRRQISLVHVSDVSDDVLIHDMQIAQFSPQICPLQDTGVFRLVSNADVGDNTQTNCRDHEHKGQSIQRERVIRQPFFGGHIFIFGFGLIVAWAIIIGLAIRA
jgi:hypothetical protein